MLDDQKTPYDRRIQIGGMIEVPAAALSLPYFLKKLDFLSIGTNDLVQFMFACDRGNPRLANRYDPVSPPVLRLLADVVAAATAHGVPLALCGEMAGQPLDALALVGIGLRNLSMAPASIGPVKAMIRTVRLGAPQEFIVSASAHSTHSLRSKLRDFARDHDILV